MPATIRRTRPAEQAGVCAGTRRFAAAAESNHSPTNRRVADFSVSLCLCGKVS
jgi:hypothetical protein